MPKNKERSQQSNDNCSLGHFLWDHKILDDSESVARIHEDGIDISTWKIKNRREFLFYGLKIPNNKEQSWQSDYFYSLRLYTVEIGATRFRSSMKKVVPHRKTKTSSSGSKFLSSVEVDITYRGRKKACFEMMPVWFSNGKSKIPATDRRSRREFRNGLVFGG